MDVLREIPDKTFDLCLCDPPYGIDACNMTMGRGSRNDTQKNIKLDWDKHPPSDKLIEQIIDNMGRKLF